MPTLTDKLLSLALALILGLSPVQAAMAGVATGGAQEQAMHQPSEPDGHMALAQMPQEQMSQQHECEQAMNTDCCGGDECSAGHCNCSLIGLVAVPIASRFSPPLLQSHALSSGVISRHPIPLYRPPRA